jgi:hypothetical protein
MVKKCLAYVVGAAIIFSIVWGCHKSSTDPSKTLLPQFSYSQSGCKSGTESFGKAVSRGISPHPTLLSFVQSPCLAGSEGSPGDLPWPGGKVRFSVSYDTLFVFHDSASYQCCAQFGFELEREGSVLDFIEADISGTPCDCMCLFDLETTATGLASGTYTARLWTEGKEILLGEAEVTITGAGGVWFETLCDTLIVHHDNWFTNCCAEIMFDFQQDGSLLVFTEIDTAASWCYCLCYFDLKAEVAGLPNGTYQVQVWNAGHIEDWDGMPDSLVGEGEVEISCLPVQSPLARGPEPRE